MEAIVYHYGIKREEVESFIDYLRRELKKKYSHVEYTFMEMEGNVLFYCRVKVDDDLVEFKLNVIPGESISLECETTSKHCIELKRVVGRIIYSFSEKPRGKLYLVFTDKMAFAETPTVTLKDKIITKMMSTNILYFLITLMIIAAFIYAFEEYAPIVLVGLQFTLLAFSDKLFVKLGKWTLSDENRKVHLLEVSISEGEYRDFMRNMLSRIGFLKEKIYRNLIAVYGKIDLLHAGEILGVYARDYDFKLNVKSIDIYNIINRISKKMGIHTPKSTILNTIIPNAAAAGISRSRSAMLITSGLLALCDEDEVAGVVAHEISHIYNRDPLALSTIVAGEYLSRVYIIVPLMMSFIPTYGLVSLIAFLYVFAVITGLFFLAKFFETRADMQAAQILGRADSLARALEKIGWKRLRVERSKWGKIRAWLSWNPHPPVYFRLKVLRSGLWKNERRLTLLAGKLCVAEFLNTLFK